MDKKELALEILKLVSDKINRNEDTKHIPKDDQNHAKVMTDAYNFIFDNIKD